MLVSKKAKTMPPCKVTALFETMQYGVHRILTMLHFGSDEGVEMAATYHSIISTVKMQGRSAWEYLGKLFTKIFNGCRDFFSMRPDKIGLTICQ